MDPKTFQQRFLARLDAGLPLAQLFEYLPEVYLYVKNHRSQFVKVNQALVRLRGLQTEEQMIGKTDLELHPRHLAEQYIEEDRRVMAGGVPIPNQVWLVPGHEGDLKWYISSKIPLIGDGGKVIGIAGVLRDFEQVGNLLRPYREMESVLAHVLRRHHERIEVADLAAKTHLSISQFDRKFKRLFQMTPQQYILRVRINTACQHLVSSNLSVAEIAHRAGFYDQSYFTKQFRKHIGTTPLAYRREYREAIREE